LTSNRSEESSASWSMPSRPLSGVRIPCDMDAKKWSYEGTAISPQPPHGPSAVAQLPAGPGACLLAP
jgi:hypothetical protein